MQRSWSVELVECRARGVSSLVEFKLIGVFIEQSLSVLALVECRVMVKCRDYRECRALWSVELIWLMVKLMELSSIAAVAARWSSVRARGWSVAFVEVVSRWKSRSLECRAQSCPLVLKSVTLEGGQPVFHLSNGCSLYFRCKKLVRDCHQDNRSTHRPIGDSEVCEVSRVASRPPSFRIPVNGDVKIVFYHRSSNRLARYDKIFHFWLNTFFVVNQPGDTPGARYGDSERGLDDGGAGLCRQRRRRLRGRDIFLNFDKGRTGQGLQRSTAAGHFLCAFRLHFLSFSLYFLATLRFSVPEYHSDDDDASGPYRSFAYTPQQAATAPPAGLSDDAGSNQQHHQSSSSSCSSQTDDDEDPEKAFGQQQQQQQEQGSDQGEQSLHVDKAIRCQFLTFPVSPSSTCFSVAQNSGL
uniref:C2 tensin-type domain-containing protein n=1 Tax=Macrostomum lignano TaxID=282301 RepID=A0A1I8JQ59_9PLAT